MWFLKKVLYLLKQDVMQASVIEKKASQVKVKERSPVKTKRNRLTRISPFLLLVGFIIFFRVPYMLIDGSAGLVQFILISVVIAYTVFSDFVIWNLFAGKRKSLIWIIESIVSILVIFLIL